MKNVWIIYVTFARDFHWLRYSLESVVKFTSGFSGVMVLVPTCDLQKFKEFERYSTSRLPVVFKDFLEYPGKGFVHHLAMKCYADVLCPDADFVLHMDPDCLFCKPTTPSDYFTNGNPDLLIEPYDLLKQYHTNRYNWKFVTQAAVGFDCEFETMCRHPAVHYAATYETTRRVVEANSKAPFIDFVLRQKNSFPQGFGEFNTLGAVVVKYAANRYNLINLGPDRQKAIEEIKKNPDLQIGHPEPRIIQMWSHGGVQRAIPEINKILGHR